MKGLVLVTGAGGFIGGHLIDALLRDSWTVRAATRNPDALLPRDGLTAVRLGDVAETRDWAPCVEGADYVVHLAGLAHATERIPEERYLAVNARPVRGLAEAARSAGVRRIVLMSSVRAQSGPVAPHVLTEQMNPSPMDAYGRSKLAAERFLANALDAGTDWTVIRPVLVYGRGVAGNMGALFVLARSPLPLPFAAVPGRRSLLSVENLGSAVLHLLSAGSGSRGVFLAADPEPVTVAEIVRAIRAGSERPARLFNLPVKLMARAARVAGQRSVWERLAGDLVVDTAALRATGWRPKESTQQGLQRWVRAERERGAG